MHIIRRLRSALSIPALALLPLAGCFDTANPSELTCTQGKYCPDGYVCVGAQTGSPGKCQKPADAGISDAISVTDGADSLDGRANTDSPVPPNDGPTTNIDMLAAIDQSPSPDISNEPDTASDLPALADLGHDVQSDTPISPPDTPADTAAPVPDLEPDQKTQGPDVATDSLSGPEVGPDVPPTSCVIGGTSYANGAANPANSCQSCQPTYALTSWTASANGATCGAEHVCSGGACQSGCWIEGALVGSDTTNPSNACQICRPATSTSGWSNNTDGTSCGSGPTCSGTTKSYGHWICQAGSCVQPVATTCPSTGCDTSAGLCKDACGTGSTAGPVQCGISCCASSQFCISNTNCGPKTGPGSTCPYGNAQCTTNYCVDGSCCNSSSCGTGQTCASGTCECAMNAARVCDTCADWDFEWGTAPSPWTKEICPNWATANGTTSIAIDSSVYHAGTGGHSLVAQISVDLSTNLQAEVALSLPCAANLAGYGISAWVYVAGPALSHWNDGLDIDTWNGSTFGVTDMAVMGGVTTSQWFQITRTLPATTTTPVNRIGFRLVPSIVWTGQMYIDDVVLTAP